MSKVVDKFLDKLSSEKLKDKDIINIKLDELFDGVQLSEDEKTKLLNSIEKNILRLRTTFRRVMFIVAVSYIVLFLSISGVELSINYFGIRLSGILKVKEVIFICASVAGVYIEVLSRSIDNLKGIRRRVLIKKFGEKAYELQEYIIDPESNSDFNIIVGTTNLVASNSKFTIEMIRASIILATLFIGFSVFLYISIFIALDIWNNSNYGVLWGRIIIGVLASIWIVESVLNVLKGVFRFTYTDIQKMKKIQSSDPKTGEIHPVLRDLINKDYAQKNMYRKIRFVGFVIIGLFYGFWLLSRMFLAS